MKKQELTFGEYLRILRRGKWIVVLCFLIVFALTAYFTYTTHPVYEATALILVKEEGSFQRQVFDVPDVIKQDTKINNHVEILKSRTLAREVIKRLQGSPYADTLWILGAHNSLERFSLKRTALSWMGQNGAEFITPSIDVLAKCFQEGVISVIPKEQTDIIELKVQSYSSFEAALVANTWMEAYQDMDISQSRGEVSEIRGFLEEKLKDVQKALSESEENLKNYKEINKVAELTAETNQLIKQAAEFEALYQESRTEFEANEKRLAYLKSQLDENQRVLVDQATSLSSPVILELQKQLAQAIGDKAAYEQQLKGAGLFRLDEPKLKSMEARLKGVQEKIVDETRKMVTSGTGSMNPLNVSESLLTTILQIETENKSLKAKTEALEKIARQYNENLNTLPEKSLKLVRLQREAEVSNNIFMMLREKYEENRIAEASQIGSVRIIDYADPPKAPIKPNKSKNMILGILVGLGLGVAVIFIRDYLDTSIKSVDDVEHLGFSVLGPIPFIVPQKSRMKKVGHGPNGEIVKIESRLITHFPPNSPVSEAYRTLRTNIQYAEVDKPVKSVLVTSPGPGEGKSTSASNIAITFAQMGMKTLLVDTDLRRPVLHAIFNLSRNDGLTNVLVGKVTLEEAVKQTKVRNLFLLTAGTLPKNPSEFLASRAMGSLLNQIKSHFEMVLFDSPPIIAVTDAAVLAAKVDGSIVVVRSRSTQRDALMQSRILLEKVKGKLFGILVNVARFEHKYKSYYDYYQYTSHTPTV